MSVKPTPVYNSANLAMFMVTLSQVLMRPLREPCSGISKRCFEVENMSSKRSPNAGADPRSLSSDA